MDKNLHSLAIRARLRAEDLRDEGDFLTAASDFATAAMLYRNAGDDEMFYICEAEEADCMLAAREPRFAQVMARAA